jgi:hypothetical protein
MTDHGARSAEIWIGRVGGEGRWISSDTIETDMPAAMELDIGHVIQVDGHTWAVIGRQVNMTRKPGGAAGQVDMLVTLRLAPRR